jgi:hypothetical protein
MSEDAFDQQQVVVPYVDLNKQEQFAFRRGVHATISQAVSDAILHKELMKRELLRINRFCPVLTKTFDTAWALGYCFGLEMTVNQKALLWLESTRR